MIFEEIIRYVLDKAKKGGVEAEAMVSVAESRVAEVRFGELDKIISRHPVSLDLRLFRGGRCASVKTSDVSFSSLKVLVKNALGMLPYGDQDDDIRLPDEEERPGTVPEAPKLYDPEISKMTIQGQIALALRMERAAFDLDSRIVNSGGVFCEVVFGTIAYGATDGFFSQYQHSLACCAMEAIAKDSSGMQTASWSHMARCLARLEDPEKIGRAAAHDALRQLGGRAVATTVAPVVFCPSEAGSLIGVLADALIGDAILHKKSFLLDKMGKRIGPDTLTVVDDSIIPFGLGTIPFDNEGVRARKKVIIENGCLSSYLLNSYTARKLGLRTTGNGQDTFSVESTNFFLMQGGVSPKDIIASVAQGLYVTGMMGQGVDLSTGDFSIGVRGLWIENGRLAYPVEQVTIAGNMSEMLQGLEFVGDDLEFRSLVSAPTIKISRMTIAGE